MLFQTETEVFSAANTLESKKWNLPVAKGLAASALVTLAIYAAIRLEWVSIVAGPILVILGIALLLAAWRNWVFGVQALLVIVVFEGAVRKWFFPSASELVYFYKDFLMAAILIGYFARRNKPPLLIKRWVRPILIVLVAFCLYAVAVVANPRLPHPVVGLFGMKAYLLYIPLAFLVPRMFPTKEKVIRFLQWYLLIALPVVLVGALQFTSGEADTQVNRYAWEQESEEPAVRSSDVAVFRDSDGTTYARVTGTFSYISGMSTYLPVVFALLLGFTSLDLPRNVARFQRWPYYIALAGVVAAAFMTGSRGAVAVLVVVALIFYSFTSLKHFKRRVTQAALGAGLIFVILTVAFPEALDAMKTRALGSEEQIAEGRDRILSLFQLPLHEATYAGAFGYGIGATQNSVPAIMNRLNLSFRGDRIPVYYEGEAGRVMLDLGVVGYLLHLLLRLVLLFTLWRIALNVRDSASRPLVIACVSVLTIHLFVGGAIVSHTQNVFQWFLVGICFALLNAEKLQETEAESNRLSESEVQAAA